MELPKEQRISVIKSFKRQGYTYAEIGKVLGVTRQRVEQLLHPKGAPFKVIKPKVKRIRKCVSCGVEVGKHCSYCTDCAKKRANKLQRLKWKTDPEHRRKHLELVKRWRKNNPERNKLIQKEVRRNWFIKNRETINTKARIKRLNETPEQREHRLLLYRKYKQKNKEKIAARLKKYYENNKQKI